MSQLFRARLRETYRRRMPIRNTAAAKPLMSSRGWGARCNRVRMFIRFVVWNGYKRREIGFEFSDAAIFEVYAFSPSCSTPHRWLFKTYSATFSLEFNETERTANSWRENPLDVVPGIPIADQN